MPLHPEALRAALIEQPPYDPDAPTSAGQVIHALRQRFSDSMLVTMTRAEFAALEKALQGD